MSDPTSVLTEEEREFLSIFEVFGEKAGGSSAFRVYQIAMRLATELAALRLSLQENQQFAGNPGDTHGGEK